MQFFLYNYDKLKVALLKRFQLTEEEFKERFRPAKAERSESPSQFLVRFTCLLRWIDMGQIDHDFDSLLMSMVRDFALFF